ncbi:MAG: C40 family peptidase [Elusimicrobia bacterium]|nr:C40 family peptidase [Elusimicrobiota bacterium]
MNRLALAAGLAALTVSAAQASPDFDGFLGGSSLQVEAPVMRPPEKYMYVRPGEKTKLYLRMFPERNEGGGTGQSLTELEQGAAVKLLKVEGEWAYVESDQRQYDDTAKSWGRIAGWVPFSGLSADAALAMSREAEDPTGLREAFTKKAAELVGVPYVWGGTSEKGVDCSGLVFWAFNQLGYGGMVPRVSKDQQRAAQPLSDAGQLKAGDLVFFAKNGAVHHVFIYTGGDSIIEAPRTGASVYVGSLAQRISGHQALFGDIISTLGPSAGGSSAR